MSNQKRFIAKEDALAILEHGSCGVLCTVSPDGEPYGVPVNYAYSKDENCVYFHCALSGRKMDNIKANIAVSFTVVGFEEVIPEKATTKYESAMVFGKAEIVQDAQEKVEKLTALCLKYGSSQKAIDTAIAKYLAATAVVKIQIRDITGKRNA